MRVAMAGLPRACGGTLLVLLAGSIARSTGQPSNDGNCLVNVKEGQLMTESGLPATYAEPDLFISMPHVLLAGERLEGAPSGEVEERACAAACRAAPRCNIYRWCPANTGCNTSLTNSSTTGGLLAYRHCAFMLQTNVLPEQARSPEAISKGPAISVTSGQIVHDMSPVEPPGYTMHMGVGWYTMLDYSCAGTLRPGVCMKQGSLQEAMDQCKADGAKCMGISWFPLGRDLLGPNVYVLKGIPDKPTTQNLPSVPLDVTLAYWNGNTVFYARNMSEAELAEARSYLPGSKTGSNGSSGDSLSAGAIAGIAVGSTLLLIAVCTALLLLRRRRATPVADAEVAGKGIKMHPGQLTPDDVASMSYGNTSSKLSSEAESGTIARSGTEMSLSQHNSIEILGADMGEWLVDVSQLKFVVDKEGMPKKLGAGAQGAVYEALLHGVEPVAVKVIPLGNACTEFVHEARMLHKLRHRNVVHLVGVSLHNDKAMVLTELMEGRDLYSALNTMDKSGQRFFAWHRRGKRVALDIASALAYLHGKRTIHFDIKSGNVLLTRDMTAKLGDVGLSKALTHTFASHKEGAVGTFAWCAPEVLMGSACSFPADVYSYGVLLWEICTGEMPVRGRMNMPQVPEQCPQEIHDLIVRCMSHEPSERPTATQLVEAVSAVVGTRSGNGSCLVAGEEGLGRTEQTSTQHQEALPSPLVAPRELGVALPLRHLPASPFA